ncbi:hypothetical protein NHH03_24930 [Stieleria sp. TO1_6]|uniref:hypothetical protein n=1 Tax=Stieleria tagensis TaxID=2956795 RepID=UPI00209ACFA9|nr:hypothetical protein [Stieleria tagensis]MCO8125005.1 hypothetical protein [Stieleria tagensis]
MIRVWVLVVAGIWMTALQPLRGEEIQLGVAPSNPAAAGFSMSVLTERLGNEGFQPVTLRFNAIGKSFSAQRQLRIQFRPRTQYHTELDFQFTCDVTVPQGVKTHDVSILVPHFYRWESCWVEIQENGRRVGKFPSSMGISQLAKDWGQHVSIGIIVPRDAASSGQPWATFPDVRSIVTVIGGGPIDDQADVKRLDDKQSRDYIDKLKHSWVRFRILDEDELQTSWLGYSQLDLILAPFPVLKRIQSDQPRHSDALQRWVSAGGQIWAYAAPPQSTATKSSDWLTVTDKQSSAALQFPVKPARNLSLGTNNDTSPIEYQPWSYGSYYQNSYAYNASGNNETTRNAVYKDLMSAKNPMVEVLKPGELQAKIGVVSYGLGRVVLIDDPDPFPGSFQLWQGLETDQQKWSQRNGVDYSTGNDSYWAWLMSAVGQPPVTAFVILNGLFVLVMGPVLYFTLRRRARLYLLYFLAPAMALVVTLGLFLYAFLSDGFDNRARVRQLTWLDGKHPTQNAADDQSHYPAINQSRQTYYTVVDNQQGLRFPDDTMVLPVHHSALMNNYNYNVASGQRPGDYLIQQQGDQRIYSGDFLPTRSQVHYLVTQPSEQTFPIDVQFDASTVTLTNRLSTPLHRVMVRDPDGIYWQSNHVPPGATVQLNRENKNLFPQIANDVIDPSTSDLPVPYQARTSLNDRTGMETKFSDFVQTPPTRSFVALTDVAADQFALRQCVPEDCVQLIGGMLP